MKSYKKVETAIILILASVALVALPVGIQILREEGWEGVWKRKRATITKMIPESAPIVDEADRATRKMGLQK
ncbi:MAG: hypothetical protein H7Y17_05715 [Chlorobia bacterium]|nr:hypothetical protein [Fimbriimonadaceae bacterium]